MSKKNLVVLSFYAMLAFGCLITSCSKSTEIEQIKPVTTKSEESSVPEFAEKPISDLLLDTKNKENYKVNLVLYHFANALKVASQTNEEIYGIVKENLQTSESLSIDLSDICSKNEDVNSFFNHVITESLLSDKSDFFADFKEGEDAVGYITHKLTYNDETYIPLAYVLEETREIDWNTKPTIAVAEGILDDVIPAWNTKGEEILLSEKQALSTNLLIIVGNGEVGSTKKKANRTLGTEFAIASPRFDCSSCAQVKINEHQVKNGFFFDNSNKCELRGQVLYYPNSTTLNNLTIVNNGPMQHFLPDILESDVSASKLFTAVQDGYELPAADAAINSKVFIAFYERDWYSSLKVIINPCNPTFNIVETRRKFSSEVYDTFCGIHLSVMPIGTTVSRNNNKFSAKFTRIQ